MTAIYSSTDLKNRQREIKDIADTQVVHITENGRGRYLFMSQEVHDREIERAVEEALYEQRMLGALRESRADFDAGRFYATRDELAAAVAEKRAVNG